MNEYWSQYIGIAIAYLIFSYLILSIFIKKEKTLIEKASIILIAVLYSIYLFYSLPDLMGWPSKQAIPEENFILKSVDIKEPNNESKGYICVWLKSQKDYSKPPRAYFLDYRKKDHENINKNQKRTGKGQFVLMRGKKKGRGGGQYLEDASNYDFKILNIQELLRKE